MSPTKTYCLKIVVWIAVLQNSDYIVAQQKSDSSKYVVRTADKEEFIAKIVSQTDSTITFKIENNLDNSKIILKRNIITHREKFISGEIVNGKYWRSFSNISYFLTPSGYSLRKGEWNIQNVWAIYNQINAAITNNVQLGIGVLPSGMLWGNVRATMPIIRNQLIVGANFIYGTHSFSNTFFENQSKMMIGYGYATIGSPNYNITFGYGTISNGHGGESL
jgi:hypothetical protein